MSAIVISTNGRYLPIVAHRKDYDPGDLTGSGDTVADAVTNLLDAEIDASLDAVAEMARILAERDEELRYAVANDRDDTGHLPPVLMCGCRPDQSCEWHSHIELELKEAA